MKRSSVAAICAVVISVCAFSGPANAAGRSAPDCDGTIDMESEEAGAFAESLRLTTKLGASVVVWGGCFKVSYIGDNGKYVTEYYDMDTKRKVAFGQ